MFAARITWPHFSVSSSIATCLSGIRGATGIVAAVAGDKVAPAKGDFVDPSIHGARLALYRGRRGKWARLLPVRQGRKAFQSWPDCIINMSGYNFRKGQERVARMELRDEAPER
jgi:hypothetical protein